jgi:methionine-rich copper-binding protein CopC
MRPIRTLRVIRTLPVIRTLRRLLGAACALLVTALVLAGPAAAHDELVNATPRAGTSVGRLPAQVRLAFDQPVLAELSVVRVTGPGGRVLSSGPATVAGTIVTQRTAGPAPAGAYRLAFRVVSADGHPVSGGWGFTVTTGSAVGAPGAGSTADAGPPAGPGRPHGTGLLALAAVGVAAVAGLALRARVLRRARAADAAEPDHDARRSEPQHPVAVR